MGTGCRIAMIYLMASGVSGRKVRLSPRIPRRVTASQIAYYLRLAVSENFANMPSCAILRTGELPRTTSIITKSMPSPVAGITLCKRRTFPAQCMVATPDTTTVR